MYGSEARRAGCVDVEAWATELEMVVDAALVHKRQTTMVASSVWAVRDSLTGPNALMPPVMKYVSTFCDALVSR